MKYFCDQYKIYPTEKLQHCHCSSQFGLILSTANCTEHAQLQEWSISIKLELFYPFM